MTDYSPRALSWWSRRRCFGAAGRSSSAGRDRRCSAISACPAAASRSANARRRTRPGTHGRSWRRGRDHRLQPACGGDYPRRRPGPAHFIIASFVTRWTRGEPRVSDEVDAVDWIDPAASLPSPATPELGEALASAARIVRRCG